MMKKSFVLPTVITVSTIAVLGRFYSNLNSLWNAPPLPDNGAEVDAAEKKASLALDRVEKTVNAIRQNHETAQSMYGLQKQQLAIAYLLHQKIIFRAYQEEAVQRFIQQTGCGREEASFNVAKAETIAGIRGIDTRKLEPLKKKVVESFKQAVQGRIEAIAWGSPEAAQIAVARQPAGIVDDIKQSLPQTIFCSTVAGTAFLATENPEVAPLVYDICNITVDAAKETYALKFGNMSVQQAVECINKSLGQNLADMLNPNFFGPYSPNAFSGFGPGGGGFSLESLARNPGGKIDFFHDFNRALDKCIEKTNKENAAREAGGNPGGDGGTQTGNGNPGNDKEPTIQTHGGGNKSGSSTSNPGAKPTEKSPSEKQKTEKQKPEKQKPEKTKPEQPKIDLPIPRIGLLLQNKNCRA